MIITFKKYFPVEHNQPPSLALFKITFRKLGGRRAAVSLQFFSVSGFGHKNMRPLLAAVTLRGAVLTCGHGPPGELDLPPPARVGLVFKYIKNKHLIKTKVLHKSARDTACPLCSFEMKDSALRNSFPHPKGPRRCHSQKSFQQQPDLLKVI